MAPTPHALAPVFALLARAYLQEPDAALLRELTRPGIADVMEELEPGFLAYARDGTWGREEFEKLTAEYTRLFVEPTGVSPFAANWMDGEDKAIHTRLERGITNLYELLRVHPADFGLAHVPADHIGMMLSLTSIALESDRSGGLAEQSLALYSDWAPRFAAMVFMTSTSPLYRASAQLLRDLVGRDTPPKSETSSAPESR